MRCERRTGATAKDGRIASLPGSRAPSTDSGRTAELSRASPTISSGAVSTASATGTGPVARIHSSSPSCPRACVSTEQPSAAPPLNLSNIAPASPSPRATTAIGIVARSHRRISALIHIPLFNLASNALDPLQPRSGARGRRTWIANPCGSRFSASIVPPIASTLRRAIHNPIPK